MTKDREKWKLRKIQITLLSDLHGLVIAEMKGFFNNVDVYNKIDFFASGEF